jgi:hypothetical protein
MDEVILQERLFDAPWGDPSFRRLPGMRPVAADDWLRVDEVYARQMALRDWFLAERRGEVVAALPKAREAAGEVLDLVLETLARRADFAVRAEAVTRPDGFVVPVVREDPFGTVGRLLQEDMCLLEKRGEEHVLTGAVLIFPSGWTLAQKIGRPLLRIHVPVVPYDAEIGRRVQRLFDGLRPGQPLMRANVPPAAAGGGAETPCGAGGWVSQVGAAVPCPAAADWGGDLHDPHLRRGAGEPDGAGAGGADAPPGLTGLRRGRGCGPPFRSAPA